MNTAPKNQAEIQSWSEVDQLINQLRAWGIEYLVGLDHSASPFTTKKDQKAAITLIQHLAQCEEYPRVRDAIISLLLLHPELFNAVLIALKESAPEVAEQIAVLTLATLYLQRLWSVRLTLALGHKPGFPEAPFAFLWENRHLPPPACHYGHWGLTALQEYEQRRTRLPFTFIGDWQNQVDHLLWQEEIKQRKQQLSVVASIMREIADEHQCEEESEMSMRPSVDRAAIESFLIQLGSEFHKPARLYLVGGAALVHLDIRPGFTQGIDIKVGGTNEGELIVAIQRLIQRMQINVEFASPGDFMPLPPAVGNACSVCWSLWIN